MNMALLRYEVVRNAKVWLIFAVILTLYTSLLSSMYDPNMRQSLEMLQASMPQVFEILGMHDAGASLIAFLNAHLFGFLYKMFPLIFILFLVHRVVIRYIDRGTLATLLATGLTRRRIALTQAEVISGYLILLLLYVGGLTVVLAQSMFPGEMDWGAYGRLMCGLGVLLLFEAGLCYLAAVTLADRGQAMSVSVGLTVLFLITQMLAQAGDTFEVLKYATPMTLFAQQDLVAGHTGGWLGILALVILGTICWSGGVLWFMRRDFSV